MAEELQSMTEKLHQNDLLIDKQRREIVGLKSRVFRLEQEQQQREGDSSKDQKKQRKPSPQNPTKV